MRYEVGQKVPFIMVRSEGMDPQLFTFPYPWVNAVTEIIIKDMTCLEHHTVPILYYDSETADGFIFKDGEGAIWHNQYPRAEYGQTTTEGDYRINLACETKEELDAVAEANGIYTMCELKHYLEVILGAIHGESFGEQQDKKAMLQKHFDDVVKQFESTEGKVHWTLAKVGNMELRGHYDVSFQFAGDQL